MQYTYDTYKYESIERQKEARRQREAQEIARSNKRK